MAGDGVLVGCGLSPPPAGGGGARRSLGFRVGLGLGDWDCWGRGEGSRWAVPAVGQTTATVRKGEVVRLKGSMQVA
jgi:hypothetical protein